MAIIDLYAKGRHYFVIAEEKNEPTYKIEKNAQQQTANCTQHLCLIFNLFQFQFTIIRPAY